MRSQKGRGKESEAPTHIIESLKISHDALVITNWHNHMICSQEAQVTEKLAILLSDV